MRKRTRAKPRRTRTINRTGHTRKKRTFGFVPTGKSWSVQELRNRRQNRDTPRSSNTANAHECEGCPFRLACTTSKYGRTPVYHEQKQKARERLESEEGQARHRQRKTDIGSVFGQIKQNRGFRRFVLRVLQKVSIEWGLICAAHNLLKKAAKDKQPSLTA
ncbi:transposase [Geobacillus jurassicus]|uniref:Transposase n=1 Tax=Geobacillus jurassicus TaxID=235932 RepID=A0ABV6GYY6_9BACL|nr:transposase [Geobacillus jurassicus]